MPEGLQTALAAVINALFLLAGIYIYLALARQIGARQPRADAMPERTFGWPEALVAVVLGTLFALNAAAATQQGTRLVLNTNDLVFNALISAGLFVFIVAFLTIRGLNVNSLGGFMKLSIVRAIATGAILLFFAYPLIFVADLVTQRVLGGAASKQGIVELFNNSATFEQRVLIIVLAIAIAPVVEEFVFRFFLYGVLRRYFGRFAGLAANAALFAAVHAHAPSVAPLFVLGSCFTLAYEWSGSILVPMTMHALFNSLTLVALAFPDLLPQ